MNFVDSMVGRQHSGYSQLHKSDTKPASTCKPRFPAMFNRTVSCLPYALLPVLLFYPEYGSASGYIHVILVPLTLLLVFAILYKLQDRLLYHPNMPENSKFHVPYPSHFPFEMVDLKTKDNEILHGFFLKQTDEAGPSPPTLIYFHGNAGNAGSPCTLPLHTLCKVNLLVVDYRGYGLSSGYPSEEGLYIDGEACIEYLASRKDVDPNKIVLFGHSMGGAVAIHLASKMQESDYRIAALIVENTFTSIPDSAKHIFRSILPGISHLPVPFYKNKFLSLDKISKVTVPILFICGEKDEILNPEMTRRLRNASDNPHTVLLQVKKGSHNDTWCVSRDYHRCISAFLRKVFNEDLETGTSSQANEMSLTWRCEVIAN